MSEVMARANAINLEKLLQLVSRERGMIGLSIQDVNILKEMYV